jgi:hypothetical protein
VGLTSMPMMLAISLVNYVRTARQLKLFGTTTLLPQINVG